MYVAQRRFAGQHGEQRCGVAAVEEGGLAGHFHAFAKLLVSSGPVRDGFAEDFNHLWFDVAADQLARRSLGDQAAVVENRQVVACLLYTSRCV